MWFIIFGFIVVAWLIIQNEKNFNKSIRILEDRIEFQQQRINTLESDLDDLRRK